MLNPDNKQFAQHRVYLGEILIELKKAIELKNLEAAVGQQVRLQVESRNYSRIP